MKKQHYNYQPSTITNNSHSTTTLCYKLLNDRYLDENGKIKEEYKFKINIPEFGIVDSKIPTKDDEKFDTYLFFPEGEGRKGEGGLRTKGYFKFSYKLMESERVRVESESDFCWWIIDSDNKPIQPVPTKMQQEINKFFNSSPPPLVYPSTYSSIHYHPSTHLSLITIITVVFNGEKYLEETIQSVINQTYPNVEYIIIDGASTDRTLNIIKKYEDKIDYWISEKDNGIYDAMNKGIMLSRGQLIGIINSDDYYKKNIFDRIAIIKNEADIIYGNMFIIDRKTSEIIERKLPNLKKLYFGMYLNHPATFVKLKKYKELGLFDDKNFKLAADYEFLLRSKVNKTKFYYFNEFLAYMRYGGKSIINFEQVIQETLLARKKNLNIFIYFLIKLIKKLEDILNKKNTLL